MIKIATLFFFVLSSSLSVAQLNERMLKQDLSKDYRYKLTESKFFKQVPDQKKEMIKDSIALGCSEKTSERVEIEFMFSIRKKRTSKKKAMHLYAVKRSDYRNDEIIINALDLYCSYGQKNYYFLSKKYILFTYVIGGNSLTDSDPKELGKIENQLVKNLNNFD